MFTKAEILKEIAREIAMREAVYPTQVRTGKLTAAEADRRISILLQVAKDYGGHGNAGTKPRD